ncbi:MAG TPA: Crp/Fnr family transcriptional regulator [Cryomorphaceae bacterium]|nr:cyclic nucleotide-binding protein [Owenweeksia sp.]MBF98926.1 cyclic nucleotide-binding protein [Owenweeksia sp.]HAD95993.1 Crp/Fnr family transcriptional regulator [Cryomorphaceae bacterium]HBF19562.1 Crp/Fnr family transcriptional regulator [Cryomorphaceae bacterium]HCQ15864.1 Crp/Fnr family transcriptional regulator [Cryomorphaceae bacterium]|tara:strand:+ start:1045 stop:1617 length:573 start_codon:yes stop_codon:yes gene_type:complete
MEQLINYLLQYGNLNPQQTKLISHKLTDLELSKDQYFSEAGKTPQQVAFILEGILRVCYYNNKGEEVTKYFIDENQLVCDYRHFEANIAASEYIQAVTDCKLLVFSREGWNELSNTIVGWDDIVNKIVQNALSQKLERRSPLVEQDATTRYLNFLEKFPQIVNRIPLSYVASYLGITQSSLSRIRKNISR